MTKLIILGAGVKAVWAQPYWLPRKVIWYFVSDAGKIAEKYKSLMVAKGIEFEEGKHSEERILSADEIMKSPGIPDKSSLIIQIRSKGIPVISEIELAYRHKGNSRILGVTGSNGKNDHDLTGLPHLSSWRIGLCTGRGTSEFSIARQVAEDPKEWYIVEISSFSTRRYPGVFDPI
ncbi:MAG: hypothetical protein WDM78_23335 [Puia sp.]